MAEDRKISTWDDAAPPVDTDSFPIVQRAQTPPNRILSWVGLKTALAATFITKIGNQVFTGALTVTAQLQALFLLLPDDGTVVFGIGNGTTGMRGNALSGLISFFTGSIDRLVIKNTGVINMPLLPTYADNSAAISGGLLAGDLYKTSAGDLRITV